MKISIIEGYLPEVINKRDSAKITYTKQDVILSKVEREQRKQDLKTASQLNISNNHKVKLFAKSIAGLVKIEARVSAITDKHVHLLGGFQIPIIAIHCVIFS